MLEPGLLDRLLAIEGTGQHVVRERLLEYGAQARRFEKYRQEVIQWLVDQGLVEADPAWLASEAPVKRRTDDEFTEKQLEIARRSVSEPVFSRYDGF